MSQSIVEFLSSIGLTLFFAAIASFSYYKMFKKRDIATAIVMFALLVHCIVFFVSFESNIGLGIGLLGILSLIRLRSTIDNLIDISFVFFAITIGLLNASIQSVEISIMVSAFLTLVLVVMCSKVIFPKNIVSTRVIFDDLDLSKLNQEKYLMEHVHSNMNIQPVKVKVTRVDYLKDAVTLRVFYEFK